MKGSHIFKPSTVVDKSILLTSIRIGGLNLLSVKIYIEIRVSIQ